MAEVSSQVRAKLLGGPEVQVLEISRQSLVLHSGVRLRPGFGINLTVNIGGAQHEVRGRIVAVDAALSAGSLQYRVGVKLDQEMPAFDAVAMGSRGAGSETEAPTPAPAQASQHVAPAPPRASGPTPAPDSKRMVELQTRLSEAERRAEEAEVQLSAHQTRVSQLEAAAAQTSEKLHSVEEELVAVQQRERLLIEHSKSAEALWQRERERLQLEAAQAQVRAEQSLRTRDEEREEWTTQESRFAAELEALSQERVRLQGDREQAEAKIQEAVEAHEHERTEMTAQRDQLASRLEATEKWCAEQQELLYQIQRHVGSLAKLFDVPSEETGPADAELRQASA